MFAKGEMRTREKKEEAKQIDHAIPLTYSQSMRDNDIETSTAKLAAADILLPAENVNLSKWATIACDQYTQDRSYWKRVEDFVGDAPSTLHLVLPEVFLEDSDKAERVRAIHAAMRAYLKNGVFAPPIHGLVYVERDTPYRRKRRGLVLAVDLESYDWSPGAKTEIRATEDTVAERLPPRMLVRRLAPLETPHVLLLIDDKERRLVEGVGALVSGTPPRYRAELMENSGTLSAWAVEDAAKLGFLNAELTRLRERSRTGYGADAAPFLYAVGDGNHSLATAKAVWEEYKAAHKNDAGLAEHPARRALVEVENIYDEAIVFEPIHRLLYHIQPSSLITALTRQGGFGATSVDNPEKLAALVADRGAPRTRYGVVSAEGCVLLETDAIGVATIALQPLLDDFIAADSRRLIDYVHGAEEVIRIGQKPDAAGILLPPVSKNTLFATIAKGGPLPRKSFSMGEASEKRFYLECRKLFG